MRKTYFLGLVILFIVVISFICFNYYKYLPQELNLVFEGIEFDVESISEFEEVQATITGSIQRKKDIADDERYVQGNIKINEGEEYPINTIIPFDSGNHSSKVYMYNSDGSYYGTARIYSNFDQVIIYRVETEASSLEDCKYLMIFSKYGSKKAVETAKEIIKELEN